MSKTVEIQIEKSRGLVEGLRRHVNEMGERGVSNKEIDEMEQAVKKKPIIHVTDLTYENIRYISTTELLEVLNRNFGGGWESLSRSVQNIILSNFDVSTVILPKDRLHKKGGFYEKKVKDGFEVLELEKGGWVEAIFAKHEYQ